MFKSSDTLHEITVVKVRIILLLHVTHEHYMGGFCRPLALVRFTHTCMLICPVIGFIFIMSVYNARRQKQFIIDTKYMNKNSYVYCSSLRTIYLLHKTKWSITVSLFEEDLFADMHESVSPFWVIWPSFLSFVTSLYYNVFHYLVWNESCVCSV